ANSSSLMVKNCTHTTQLKEAKGLATSLSWPPHRSFRRGSLRCIAHFANLRRAQNSQEMARLLPQVAEPFHQSGRKSKHVPRTQSDFILTFVSPIKNPLTGEGHEHLDRLVAVQRRAFSRIDYGDGHGKAMFRINRRDVLRHLANNTEGLHPVRNIATAHGF